MAKGGLFMLRLTPILLKIQRYSSAKCQHKSYGSSEGRQVQIGTVFIQRSTMRVSLAFVFGILMLHEDKKGSQRPLRSRGSQESTLLRLAEWLAQREREISETGGGASENPLPTRVLDLGESKGDDMLFLESDLRLAETAEHHGRYAALSYCWGGYMGFRTLKDNYQERLDKIEFKRLPAVFAQAVKLTRALKVRYLRIDALCIIQNDHVDWRREAAKMSDIYWNTVCRLAVTDSKNPTEGFFPPRPITASVPMSNLRGVDARTEDTQSPNLYLTLPKFCSDDVDHGHLDTRGWVTARTAALTADDPFHSRPHLLRGRRRLVW